VKLSFFFLSSFLTVLAKACISSILCDHTAVGMLDLFLCSGPRDLDLDLPLAGLLGLDAALPAGTGVLDLVLLLLGRVGVLALLLVGEGKIEGKRENTGV
jgi:hypothetical protein